MRPSQRTCQRYSVDVDSSSVCSCFVSSGRYRGPFWPQPASRRLATISQLAKWRIMEVQRCIQLLLGSTFRAPTDVRNEPNSSIESDHNTAAMACVTSFLRPQSGPPRPGEIFPSNYRSESRQSVFIAEVGPAPAEPRRGPVRARCRRSGCGCLLSLAGRARQTHRRRCLGKTDEK